jgi:hypothetical protein
MAKAGFEVYQDNAGQWRMAAPRQERPAPRQDRGEGFVTKATWSAH